MRTQLSHKLKTKINVNFKSVVKTRSMTLPISSYLKIIICDDVRPLRHYYGRVAKTLEIVFIHLNVTFRDVCQSVSDSLVLSGIDS